MKLCFSGLPGDLSGPHLWPCRLPGRDAQGPAWFSLEGAGPRFGLVTATPSHSPRTPERASPRLLKWRERDTPGLRSLLRVRPREAEPPRRRPRPQGRQGTSARELSREQIHLGTLK